MTVTPRTLLAASLLANLFAVGVLGGGVAILVRDNGPQLHALNPLRPLMRAGHDLPPADRMRFRRTVRAAIEGNRDLRRTARDSRAEARALFLQPAFDRAAAAAALDQARAADFAIRTRLENAELDFAADLPADERALLAAGLERGGALRPGAGDGLPQLHPVR